MVQPGDLGDSDPVASSASTTESTDAAAEPATTTTVVVTTTAGVAPGASTPADGETPTTTVPEETAPTVAGSGMAGGGTPTGGADGIAETGHESMLGAGLALGALGLALRRLRPFAR